MCQGSECGPYDQVRPGRWLHEAGGEWSWSTTEEASRRGGRSHIRSGQAVVYLTRILTLLIG